MQSECFDSVFSGLLLINGVTVHVNKTEWDPRYIVSRRIHRKHRFLCCLEGVFTAPLHTNGSYSVAVWVFYAAGICLADSCLAMDVSSDFTIPAFGRHVTILTEVLRIFLYSMQANSSIAFPIKTASIYVLNNSLLAFHLTFHGIQSELMTLSFNKP
jgi:hypothetical protein